MQLIDRAIKVLGCSDDTGLAKKLGKDKSTISKWRTSGAIPAKAERELLELMGGCLQEVIDDNIVTIPLYRAEALGSMSGAGRTNGTDINGWYKVPRRETYIKPGELCSWIPAALQLGYDTSSDFLLLMLFQGSRKTETATLRWKDINLDAGTAVFRETKTGVALEVPLSRFIIERLEKRKPFYCDGPDSYVFPSYGKTGHIVDARTALSAIHSKSGVMATHHDLRRSFITYCEELEITLFSRKRLANHAIPLDVTEGYTFFNMEKLRAIIERIAEFILTNAGLPTGLLYPLPCQPNRRTRSPVLLSGKG